MCHCRPSKFPFGSLTHDNINSLQFIVHFLVCLCEMTFLSQNDENTDLSKKVTLKMSHLASRAPWLAQKTSFLFVTASCLDEWWGVADQWEGSGEDATVIQEKTAPLFPGRQRSVTTLPPALAARPSGTPKDPVPPLTGETLVTADLAHYSSL